MVETGQVTVVNSQGGFVLNGVDQGIYTIEFFRSGFKKCPIGKTRSFAGTSTKIRSNNVVLNAVRGEIAGRFCWKEQLIIQVLK